MKRRFDDIQLGSIELFCSAVQLGSFTAAAAAAGVTPAAVSRTIGRMEKRLGARLFVRTTRQIRLTDAGRNYFEQCQQALALLTEAEQQVTRQQVAPAGTLRISVPTTYGHCRVLPLLPAFRARYPQIRVDVHVSNRNVDFAAEGHDLAIRMRAPTKDSSLIVRKLEDAPMVIVAAPDYLRRAGTPKTVDDLRRHECIQFLRPNNGRKAAWALKVDGKERKIPTTGSYTCSEDVLGCVTLARAGAGLFQIMRFVVDEDLQRGSLVEVLRPFAADARQVTLVYPHGKSLPLRVRAFVDFMVASVARR
jgi:DNA-binding transcriptional LysR family regulator